MVDISRPLKGFRYSLVGPGRVGRSLASWMTASGACLVQVVGRPQSNSASDLVEDLGGTIGSFATLAKDEVDLLLLAVPDGHVRPIAEGLAGDSFCRVALHTAGSLGASALEPLRPQISVGSFHPLKAFPEPFPDPASARGIFFALDGDPGALELGARLAELWDASAAPIDEKNRDLYHLAARLAAGGVTTLLSLAAEIASRAHLPPEVVAGYFSLAKGAILAASSCKNPGEAITGPIARSELPTLLRQLHQIHERAPDLRPVVSAIDLETIRQLERLDGPSEARQAMRKVLTEESKEHH